MASAQFGVVGLSTMGRGLALNLAEHGFSVAGYNREPEMTAAFLEAGIRAGYSVCGCRSYQELCEALERPRKILIMVMAGKPIDYILDELLPLLDAGDIVIDGGNSYFEDTITRQSRCKGRGIFFLGMGVSGGEVGARIGPALMPGGSREAYEIVEPFLTAIAAHVDEKPCCSYIGSRASGHYVKMVHNGIEYGDMELICEAYYLLKRLLGLSTVEISERFDQWNQGELSSYLVEITAHILREKDDETGHPLVDMIRGEAGSKGTGMWTVQQALELGVPLPTIAQAVFARYLSNRSDVRRSMSVSGDDAMPLPMQDHDTFTKRLARALYASKICSYAQGFELLRSADRAYGWGLRLDEVALLFRGGCIIRAAFLNQLAQVFQCEPQIDNILLDESFSDALQRYYEDWRYVVVTAAQHGVAAPALTASLNYYDALRDAEGPLNLLQAQRDCFGAHTYQRIDRPGSFHHRWTIQ